MCKCTTKRRRRCQSRSQRQKCRVHKSLPFISACTILFIPNAMLRNILSASPPAPRSYSKCLIIRLAGFKSSSLLLTSSSLLSRRRSYKRSIRAWFYYNSDYDYFAQTGQICAYFCCVLWVTQIFTVARQMSEYRRKQRERGWYTIGL